MNTKLDLSKYTDFELRELRCEIQTAINDYQDRDKTECYMISVEKYDLTYIYKDKKKAIAYLKDMIEEDEIFDSSAGTIKLSMPKLHEAEISEYCQDTV